MIGHPQTRMRSDQRKVLLPQPGPAIRAGLRERWLSKNTIRDQGAMTGAAVLSAWVAVMVMVSRTVSSSPLLPIVVSIAS